MTVHYLTDRYRFFYDVELARRIACASRTSLLIDFGPARLVPRTGLAGPVVFGAGHPAHVLRALVRANPDVRLVCIVWNNLQELASSVRTYDGIDVRFVVLDRALVVAAAHAGLPPVDDVDLRISSRAPFAHRERALPLARPQLVERAHSAWLRIGAARRLAEGRVVFAGRCELGEHRAYSIAIATELSARGIAPIDDDTLGGLRARAIACVDEATIDALRGELARAQPPLAALLYGEYLLERFRNHQRYRMLVELRRRLGARLLLIGDDFVRLGLGGVPSIPLGIEHVFRVADATLDFGSNAFARTIYPRSLSIVKAGGRLLQLRQPDADVLGDDATRASFSTIDELEARLARLDEVPRELPAFHAAPHDSFDAALYGDRRADA